MGGGVVYKALEMAPGLVDAGVVFASVSSDDADNYRQFGGPSPTGTTSSTGGARRRRTPPSGTGSLPTGTSTGSRSRS